MNDPLKKLCPFYVGQKVVYITGINMPKNSIHVVSQIFRDKCGCVVMGIDNIPVQYRPLKPGYNGWCCLECGYECDDKMVYDGGSWSVDSFRAAQEQTFPLMTFSEIHKHEEKEVLVNN